MDAFNETNDTSKPPVNRAKSILDIACYVSALVLFFLIGFWLIGPRLQRPAASPSSPQTELSEDNGWQRAPEPPKPKKPEPPEVEVNEIPRPAEPAGPSGSDAQANTLEELSHSPDTASNTPTPEVETNTVQPKRYYVQAGVYSDKTNARTTAAQLADEGYGAGIRQITRGNTTVYQVVIGGPREKADAQRLLDELKKTGKDVILAPAD